MFPNDKVLIARGKYSTLGKDRREQVERVQKACHTLVSTSYLIMKDSELIPPESNPLKTAVECLKNIEDARAKIINLCTKMIEIKSEAWPE